VLLLVLSVTVFGMVSYIGLPREAAPDVKIPVVLVSTPYIGVSPSDIESLVTIPIENELAGVSDLKKMSSTSAEGVSIVSLEFEPDIQIEDALQQVRDRVNRAKPSLPEDAKEPQVQEISFSDVPTLLVTIAGEADQEKLKKLAEDVQDEVKRIPGVLDAEISGGLEREFRVEVDPRRLAPYQMSLNDVVSALQNENVNIPGGTVLSGDSNYLLRVPGEFQTGRDLESVAIKRKGDAPVFVRDVARVVEGFADVSSYSRMNGNPAVTLSVTKRAGASIIEINDSVKEIAELHSERWPDGVEFRVLADQSKMIRQMVADLENNIITSLLLVMAVIIFFMGVRNSLFVAFSIPMSMLMSFVFIETFGMTLNMIVLFSLILVLGMLVDNAIVIVENVYRHMEEGSDIVTASIEGTREVALAVAASTATTVAAFFPLVFWTGIMGQFMGYLPKTVIIVLLSSLVVAIAMLPVITSHWLRRVEGQVVTNDDDTPTNAIMALYKQTLVASIRNRKTSLGLGLLTFVFTLAIFIPFNHGVEFFPATEPDRATISVVAPDGTDLSTTDRIVRRVEAVLASRENVDVYVAETGVSGGGSPLEGSQAQANAARITVDFLPHSNDAGEDGRSRVENTELTIAYLRKTLQQIPGADIEIKAEEKGPPVGAAISVEVTGNGFHEVGAIAQKVKRRIAGVQGTTEITDDYKVGRPEMRLRIDRAKAKRVGASTGEVANTIRTAVAGSIATTVRDGSDEYDVLVQLDPRFRSNLQDVLNLRIPGRADNRPGVYAVPLSAVASYELAGGNGSIRHIDQNLVVTIGGDVSDGYNQNEVRAQVVAEMEKMKAEGVIPSGFDVRLGGASDEQDEAASFLLRAFGLAIALIAIVLVTQFNNFRLPAIVLASVGLSLVGVFWGLLITGTSFGVIMTGLGVISLAGVVVNNAIVLLDYVEQLRERGMPVEDALVKAGMTRFRPVMLTAITTILGLVPMAMGWSVDFRSLPSALYRLVTTLDPGGLSRILLLGGSNSQFWGPMAVSVIFGLAFATVLTLVMVPTLYSIFEDFSLWMNRTLPSSATSPSQTETI
jgi:multidrug efflux pump subunit AcrB